MKRQLLEKIIFQQMVLKELHIHRLKMNFNCIWHHTEKFNSKWIIDLNVK